MFNRSRIRPAAVLFLVFSFVPRADERLDAAMDAIVTRLYAEKSLDQLRSLTPEQVEPYLTPDIRDALATAYWQFDVNVPAVVSVMRHVKQQTAPSWLAEAGFTKTDLVVRNESCDYEVWQKRFEAGRVALGINGFDGHRFCYFVCVGSQTPGAEVRVSNVLPADPPIGRMDAGATTYTDWTELVLTEVPDALRGHVLLTTYRGRARECHLFGGFRETPFPSSDNPDQITLTWSENPKTTQAVLWRTNTSVANGTVRYREKAAPNVRAIDVRASLEPIDDRMLTNDRTSHRHTAVMRNLKPGTTYAYKVGESERNVWSEEYEFTTAPASGDAFSFVHLTDTHNREVAGKLLAAAYARESRPSLVTISGDLVDYGLHRDCWDKLFAYLGEPIARIPVIPSIGNHDDQDGLGPGTFLKQFALPSPNFEGLPAERACAIRYANALFLVIPIGLSVETIGAWLEQELAATDATWKFGIYHFPMYSTDPEYAGYYDKQESIWARVFDKYHLDFMLTGHTHNYERHKPIYGGKEVDSPNDGTVYLVSAPGHYSTFDIRGRELDFKTIDAKGNVTDTLTIKK
ncbi:MAG: metallophosphoesterase family protein [Candidatus Hydrogenedentes bacterium]|nr:metallophosphoesterase family protein [Candidatus Hydrogenedentota bacterium]